MVGNSLFLNVPASRLVNSLPLNNTLIVGVDKVLEILLELELDSSYEELEEVLTID